MTSLVVPLMIGLLAAGSPTVWIVQLVDGSSFTAVAPPEEKGRMAIAHLEDGTLVSVRRDRIVRVKPIHPQVPERSSRSAGAAGTGGATGDTPRVMDNTTLDVFLSTLPEDELPQATGDARVFKFTEPVEPSRLPPPAEPVDKYGQGRRYWEQRARPAVSALRRARLGEDAARRRLEEAERDVLYGTMVTSPYAGGFGVTHYAVRGDRYALMRQVQRLRDVLELATINRIDAEQNWASLREEARRAGAWPGWLRVP